MLPYAEVLDELDEPQDDEDADDPEPLLKFRRIEGNLVDVFQHDIATCLAVHARYLVRRFLLKSIYHMLFRVMPWCRPLER